MAKPLDGHPFCRLVYGHRRIKAAGVEGGEEVRDDLSGHSGKDIASEFAQP
jgi:hypothetical protein